MGSTLLRVGLRNCSGHGYSGAVKLDQLGNRLRNLRKSEGLTVKEVSSSTGVGSSQIGHIEGGRRMPPLPTLEAFAEAVNHRLELRLIKNSEDLTEVAVSPDLVDAVEILDGLDGLDRRLALQLLRQMSELSDDAKRMMLGMLQVVHDTRADRQVASHD